MTDRQTELDEAMRGAATALLVAASAGRSSYPATTAYLYRTTNALADAVAALVDALTIADDPTSTTPPASSPELPGPNLEDTAGRWVRCGPEAWPTARLHLEGGLTILGVPVHVTAILVGEWSNGEQYAIGHHEQHDLTRLRQAAGSDSGFQATAIPGYPGQYVIFTTPHDR